MLRIELPFPPSILSAHAKGNDNWRKIAETKRCRALAKDTTETAGYQSDYAPPENGDIRIDMAFIPPDNRGDRCNYPARMKAYIDGIAEAMCVNDKRFLPSYRFLPNAKPGCVIVTLFEENE